MSTREPSVRIVTGESVEVGGVPVTVEMDEGELVVRIGRAKRTEDGLSIDRYGKGHVTVRVEGGANGVKAERISIWAEDADL